MVEYIHRVHGQRLPGSPDPLWLGKHDCGVPTPLDSCMQHLSLMSSRVTNGSYRWLSMLKCDSHASSLPGRSSCGHHPDLTSYARVRITRTDALDVVIPTPPRHLGLSIQIPRQKRAHWQRLSPSRDTETRLASCLMCSFVLYLQRAATRKRGKLLK